MLGASQESVIKMLIGMEEVQTELIQALLENVVVYAQLDEMYVLSKLSYFQRQHDSKEDIESVPVARSCSR